MQFTCLKENLKRAVNKTSHFTAPKAQLPILGNVLIKADKSKVWFSATNLENSITTSISAKVEKVGEITIPGKTLVDIVNNLVDDHVEIEREKESLKIKSGSFKSTIMGILSTDFPKVPNKIIDNFLEVEDTTFKKVVSKIIYSLSLDETRPILTGVLFDYNKTNNNFILVATDGFRLSKKSLKTIKNTESFEKVIVPKTILHEVLKDENVGLIKFVFDTNSSQFIIESGENLYSTRIIEGQFPDYQKIIPKESFVRVCLDKQDFEKSVRLASVFARESGNIIKLKIIKNRDNKEKLKIISESSSIGEQVSEIEAKIEADSDFDEYNISFNYKFIEDYLKSVESDDVIIEFNTEDKAAKFLDSKDSDFLHLIMPIKAN